MNSRMRKHAALAVVTLAAAGALTLEACTETPTASSDAPAIQNQSKSEESMTNERNGGYATISEDEAVAMMSENSATLVDVRTAREYADGHIPGAINIPVETIGSVKPRRPSRRGRKRLHHRLLPDRRAQRTRFEHASQPRLQARVRPGRHRRLERRKGSRNRARQLHRRRAVESVALEVRACPAGNDTWTGMGNRSAKPTAERARISKATNRNARQTERPRTCVEREGNVRREPSAHASKPCGCGGSLSKLRRTRTKRPRITRMRQ